MKLQTLALLAIALTLPACAPSTQTTPTASPSPSPSSAATRVNGESQIGLTDAQGRKVEVDLPDDAICYQKTVQVTLEVFDRCLINGLTFVQVSNAIGYKGTLVSQSGSLETMRWGSGTDGKQIFGTFQDGKLISKTQTGLQ